MQVSIDVDAPQQRTWEVLSDLDSSSRTISAIESVERLDGGGPITVGTRWRETRRMLGQSATEEMEILELDPPRSYVVGAESNGAVYRTVMSVEETAAASCRVSMSFDASPTSRLAAIASRVMSPLISRSMRKALRQDLVDIKRAAESR